MAETHTYDVAIEWTGNLGSGTDTYRSFSRAHEVLATGKPPMARALHGEVHALCFIARSVNFPIRHEPVIRVQ
jgi:organic hydroperoxide reductase OsmC/OhrA